jgi:hypothetical protein
MLSALKKLRACAAAERDAFTAEHGASNDDPEAVLDRWVRYLVDTGQVPDDILEAMPEVSRHNSPRDSPQEYECGCVAITRITDREYRYDEKPFEMRLALPCEGPACELAHLRAKEDRC